MGESVFFSRCTKSNHIGCKLFPISRCREFKRAVAKTGQVAIQVRDVHGASGGDGQDDNPFEFEEVKKRIIDGLSAHGYEHEKEYIVLKVPNVTDISYGRGVGYTFTEHDLGEEIHKISATKIRKKMRDQDEL